MPRRTLSKDEVWYDPDVARICLECSRRGCPGECEHLKQEKKRIKDERAGVLSAEQPTEEFIIPDEPPPYIKP